LADNSGFVIVPPRRPRPHVEVVQPQSQSRGRRHRPMVWTRAASLAEVKERGVMDAEVNGQEIALYWVDDNVYATDNVCTHAFARLSEGFLDGECIECPIHQALFNVKTGEVMAPPAYTPVKTFACRIEDDKVLVDI
jgi:nitrite reductase/ring-hydroxylating ferredoxin subunit